MSVLHGDFETRSVSDLRKEGLDRYASHQTTDALCLGFAFNDEPADLWLPGERLPSSVVEHVESGGLFYAHNAQFELTIWNRVMAKRYGWPILRARQVRCTMAMAYAMALPGSLDRAAAAVGLEITKDAAGHRIMMQLCKPKALRPDGSPEWHTDPEKYEKLYAYCKTDVDVERALHKRLLELSPSEQALWALDQKINARGVQIDVEAARIALEIVEHEKNRLDDEMNRLTGGMVSRCSNVGRLGDYLKGLNVKTGGVAKADIALLLANPNLHPDARYALELRRDFAKTSTAKLDTMLDILGPENRVRFILQYHAAGTGRWGGRKIQPQNFPRGTLKDEEVAEYFSIVSSRASIADKAKRIDMLMGSPLDVTASALRGFLVAAPGNELVAVDLSNIEGRGLAYLAGEEWKLDAFRDFDAGKGEDIYKLTYAESFGVEVKDVTKDNRQVGKVQELAFGYQGGAGACRSMAKIYGVKVTDDQAETWKNAWRSAHPHVVQYWYDLERAAIAAIRNPGQKFTAGASYAQVTYKAAGSFLWCRLPSGRVLCYPYARIGVQIWATFTGAFNQTKSFAGPTVDQVEWQIKEYAEKNELTVTDLADPSDAIVYKAVDTQSGKFVWCGTYGGSLAENNTQAFARDILSDAMPIVEAKNYPIVFHVHDEVVAEVLASLAAQAVDVISTILSTPPAWAATLPLAAEGWHGPRYRK